MIFSSCWGTLTFGLGEELNQMMYGKLCVGDTASGYAMKLANTSWSSAPLTT